MTRLRSSRRRETRAPRVRPMVLFRWSLAVLTIYFLADPPGCNVACCCSRGRTGWSASGC